MNHDAAATDHAHVQAGVVTLAVREGRTNLGRALNGRDMCASALNGSAYMAFEDYESGLVDALVNLMHFARRYDIDFTEHLDIARRHHDAEKASDWEEFPTA